MAEIEIQRRRNPGPWGWVAGIVIVALIVWGVAELMDNTDDFATAPAEEVTPLEPTPYDRPVQPTPTGESNFQAWVRDSAQALEQMGRQHEYTREGIERMTAALENLVQRDDAPEIEQQLEALEQHRERIRESDATSLQHANEARQAFIAAVEVLELLKDRPQLREANLQSHVDAARASAQRIDASKPLLEQRAAVHQFFEQMAAALQLAERQYRS